MSEDSDSLSCKNETCAPLLPPRKRLLAGLKQNGWCSPSCSAASMEDTPITEALGQANHEDDQDSIEAEHQVSLQCPPKAAAESMESVQESRRKSERNGTLSSKQYKKKKRQSSGLKDVSELGSDAKNSLVNGSDTKQFSVTKDDGGIDTLTGEAEKGRQPVNVSVDAKEADGGAELAAPIVDFVGLNPRMDPNRHQHSKNKAIQLKRSTQNEINADTPLALTDEELARQLHRAMNSSPRISRSASIKEERLSSSIKRKSHPGR